jgi:hypothetical protein
VSEHQGQSTRDGSRQKLNAGYKFLLNDVKRLATAEVTTKLVTPKSTVGDF